MVKYPRPQTEEEWLVFADFLMQEGDPWGHGILVALNAKDIAPAFGDLINYTVGGTDLHPRRGRLPPIHLDPFFLGFLHTGSPQSLPSHLNRNPLLYTGSTDQPALWRRFIKHVQGFVEAQGGRALPWRQLEEIHGTIPLLDHPSPMSYYMGWDTAGLLGIGFAKPRADFLWRFLTDQ